MERARSLGGRERQHHAQAVLRQVPRRAADTSQSPCLIPFFFFLFFLLITSFSFEFEVMLNEQTAWTSVDLLPGTLTVLDVQVQRANQKKRKKRKKKEKGEKIIKEEQSKNNNKDV